MHTGYHCSFVGVCKNVTINVDGLVIQTLVFIMETAHYLLLLGQPFLYKGKFSQQCFANGMYGHLTDHIKMHTIVFPILGPNDWANWKKVDLFQSQSLKV